MIDRRSVLAGSIAAVSPAAQALKAIGLPPEAPEVPALNAVSVRDFGAIGDGQADDRAAVQRAYDTLAQHGGGRLYFPPGRYRIALILTSRAVHLSGAGASSSILVPAMSHQAAVTALYRNGSITPVAITDLGFQGVGRSAALFAAGGPSYVADAEYSGLTHFAKCAFDRAEKCIARRYGSIDLQIDQCQFSNADYHIHITTPAESDGADVMHGGCLVLRRSWLTRFKKAMLFVDSPVLGSGQIVLEQNIVELGEGFVHYFKRFYGSRAPGIVIRDQWNELTATAKDVALGTAIHPRAMFLYAERVSPTIVVENTPLGGVGLRSSSMVTRGCDLSDLEVEIDRDSTVVHDHATALTGTVPGRTRSIAAPIHTDQLRSPWFRIALPNARSAAFTAQTLFADDCAEGLDLTGSRMEAGRIVAGDAGIPEAAACTELSLKPDDRLFPPMAGEIPGGHWIVTLLIYRILSGLAVAQITGRRGLSGGAQLTSGSWEALVNLSRPAETAIEGNSLHLTCVDDAIVRLGGIALIATPTLAQGLDFANGLIFPSCLVKPK